MENTRTNRGMKRMVAMALVILMIAMSVGTVQAAEASETHTWVEAADVVVVGGGGAGFAAAVEAANAGASVLVLEKAGICGGNTLRSGGMILAGGTSYQEELGITDTAEHFAAQQMAYHSAAGDLEMVREMSLASAEAFEFMRSLGRTYDTVSLMPPAWGYDNAETVAARTHWEMADSRDHFIKLLEAADATGNVRYYTDSEVTKLITTGDNEVIGVETISGDKFRANNGVILACGSFDKNIEMSKQYNPMNYWAMQYEEKYNYAANLQTDSNTGDGIRMAQAIGADLMLSGANCISDIIWFGGANAPLYSAILVNENGMRFVQESAHWGYVNGMVYREAVKTNTQDADSIHFWGIMGQNAVDNNPYINGLVNDYGITAKPGFSELIEKADTIEELAEKIGLPVENLTYTVNRWNELCAAGEDTDYGRKMTEGTDVHMADFGDGPYYAIPYIPYSMGSFGGLKTDNDTQVIDVNDAPISRLYAAGSIMSGMYTGNFYSSCGWSVLGTVYWGRKAGKNVAELSAWTSEEVASTYQAGSQVEAQTGHYNAGSYSATVPGHNGEFTVTVECSDTLITSITVGEHVESDGIGTVAFEKLTSSILAGQSADIDTVSGATVTSQAFLDAVKACIDQANVG